MEIFINGTSAEIDESNTLEKLLKINFSSSSSYAVAVNSEFVPRSKYKDTILLKGDKVEVVSAHPGG
jgi:sulfur carrier protein